jgi:hypothetical protein
VHLGGGRSGLVEVLLLVVHFWLIGFFELLCGDLV